MDRPSPRIYQLELEMPTYHHILRDKYEGVVNRFPFHQGYDVAQSQNPVLLR